MTPQHAAYVLATQSAIKALRAQIKRSGGNPSLIPASRLARLAHDHVQAHPEMLVEALEVARELGYGPPATDPHTAAPRSRSAAMTGIASEGGEVGKPKGQRQRPERG